MSYRSRKIIFYTIAILIPIIFFVIFELILRIFHYRDNLSLALTVEQNGVKFFQLNQDVGQRYFVRTPKNLIPQLYPQTFEYKKSPQTFRIFLLGGSTMAGFPYELNARINSLLEDRLMKYYPDKKIEVVNVGLSAINSFSVVDFVKELVDYESDLFIVYMGHNEFYGAYGVGSVEGLGKHPAVIRTYLSLNKFKLFLLIRDIIQKVGGIWQKSPELTTDRTLMASMAQKKSIPLNSKDYLIARTYFTENLEKIIGITKKNNVPILISKICSNLRGQKPFQSLFSDTLSNEDRQT